MSVALQGLTAVLVLAAFAAAYFSFKTWRIYNVLLALCVIFTGMTFFYLAARTLETHRVWRTTVIEFEKKIAELEPTGTGGVVAQNDLLRAQIRDTDALLHRLSLDRGQVWFGATPQKVQQDGSVSVTLAGPAPAAAPAAAAPAAPAVADAAAPVVAAAAPAAPPALSHGIAPKTVLFVFEQTDVQQGGAYLGEFEVKTAAPKSNVIELTPNEPLTENQAKRLSASRGPWALYALMPIDDAKLFAGMPEAERSALIHKAAQAEFAKADRSLRDYAYLFHQANVNMTLTEEAIGQTQADLDRVTAAEAKTQDEIKYRTTEKQALTFDKGKFQGEVKIVAAYLARVQAVGKDVQSKLTAVLASNQKLAAELTRIQTKASEEINRRAAAQASAGSPPAPATP